MMKTPRSILVLALPLLVLLSFISISRPSALWAGGPTVEVFQLVQFSDDSSGGPTSWLWDFDYDGGVPESQSVIQNPVHTFTEVATFDVYLEVCNFAGCNFTVRSVTVTEPNELFADDFETGDFSNWMVFDLP